MKIIKINAIWCSACLVMNKVFKEIEKEKNIEVINIDYDMEHDEAIKYNPGNVLPVMIFLSENGKEVERLVGEVKRDKIIDIIDKLGG